MTRFANPQLALQWHQRIKRFAQSELTVADFCRLEGFSQAAFYRWRQKLADDEARNPARFVPVEVQSGDLRSNAPDCIEVSLPGGALVKMPASVAWTDCRHLIAAIVEATTARGNASSDEVIS